MELSLIDRLLTFLRGEVSQKNYSVTPAESLHYANEVFKFIHDGRFEINIHKEYPFTAEGVADSQNDLTGRSTLGKLVIKVAESA